MIKTLPAKNFTSMRLSPFIKRIVIKVTINVIQFTTGTAILRSLFATKKLFKIEAAWFNRKGTKNLILVNIVTPSTT